VPEGAYPHGARGRFIVSPAMNDRFGDRENRERDVAGFAGSRRFEAFFDVERGLHIGVGRRDGRGQQSR